MNSPMYIPISARALSTAVELARQCSATTVRERVLVSQIVALAAREYLHRTAGIQTGAGRSAALKYVELLDICDFNVNNWRVEMRVVTNVEQLALYVPTVPLMVGVLADVYVSARIDKDLTGAEMLGWARCADLAAAELSANGLFATLLPEELQPFEVLPEQLQQARPFDARQEHAFEAWQTRADRIVRGVSEVLAQEGAFGSEHIARLAAGLRDDILCMYGTQLPETGLEPLFERLFRYFGLATPVPASPASPIAFQNRIEDHEKFSSPVTRMQFFTDELMVGERVGLYRYLLEEDAALEEHRRIRHALDHATAGKHQASTRRRAQLQTWRERRHSMAESNYELPAASSAQSTAIPSPVFPSEHSMNIFGFRDQIIHDYATYIKSFIQIRDTRISEYVGQNLNAGILWPEPLIQLNPDFKLGEWIETLITHGVLHPECARIFLKDKGAGANGGDGKPLRLYHHQVKAIDAALTGENYVLTTGTGSGKSLAYIVPIVNHVLRRGSGKGIQAIVVYPMNALANSQYGELEKFLCHGYAEGKSPVTFARYTGQETDDERAHISAKPPDILLTNYVMLELILTRHDELPLINAAQGLRFLVLDELHTYRGRQGSDVALLIRRVRDRLAAEQLQCVGTSATIAGGGTYDEQRIEVARVATQVFGAEVRPERIIMEKLRRTTPDRDMNDTAFIAALTQRVQAPDDSPQEYKHFINDPLSIWIESTFGVRDDGQGRLVRQIPQSISGENGAAARLRQITGADSQQCALAIQRGLLAGYACTPNPDTGFPPFAFRLHQFISRGDTVYATLESEEQRHLTTTGQQFKPGSREHVLLPLVFCRECGQEYYCVRRMHKEGIVEYVPRELRDQQGDHESEPSFIYLSTTHPWPVDDAKVAERLPDDWTEERQGARRVRRDRQKELPELVRLHTKAVENVDGIAAHYISAPFRFCLHCGVSWGARQRDDFAKLTSLGSEGRSTATTILSLSAIRNLRQSGLQEDARKLLSFTDNRQDASLQAGHFNDFIETTLLRSALYQAVSQAGTVGIGHDELTLRVFEALKLPLPLYAYNPEVKFQALRDTERALREVIGYRLYRDLQRGWRITSPNLEQCGLLEIEYESLDEASAAAELWSASHPALTTASTETRMQVAKVLLDYMRRELAISVNYLDSTWQEQIRQQSNQRLIAPWAIDENETMEYAAILFPRSRTAQDQGENVFLSARGGFGQYLRRNTTFPELGQRLSLEDTPPIIRDLLRGLVEAGLVNVVLEPQSSTDVPGYQLQAAAMRWKIGDGTRAFHDPIRVPSLPEAGGRTNPFFVNFYRTMAGELHGLEAREHTAQVEYEERRKRERDFRAGKLPVLYCSPTMELGVDIAELNVVNLRNIPPTPANYAQRSGRAGRSGQPALVFSYCTTGSPHDQYFFKRPELMVAGQVSPPRLDLANEDLLRAHIYAIWLAETGMSLGKSPKDLLDVTGSQPTLALREAVRDQITAPGPQQRARVRAIHVLGMLQDELHEADWYPDGWLEDVLNTVAHQFDSKLERWRDLYRAALNQAQSQDRIIRDASRSPADKKQAERLRAEAEAQLKLLTEVESIAQADFYSYRYFASEGFLPGYNFPRLPISAYIPGRRTKQRDEFLSRPRFLAISEFGPRSIVYHEGSRYIINKVILPVSEDHVHGNVNAGRAKLCDTCGYLHPLTAEAGADLCERCGALLGAPLHALFKMQNVSARRRDKINSDEEERVRLGYELQTGVRFPEHTGRPSFRTATVAVDGEAVFRLTYGQAATLWRINLGWARRQEKNQFGFVLDTERGYWAKDTITTADPDDPVSVRTTRVIPYVEDTRNCLLIVPATSHDLRVMASLQAALKTAIQVSFQLEDNELAAEPLPNGNERHLLLLYESAEGGAGVLRRLLDDPQAMANVARTALEICHFDPVTGADQRHAPRAKEACEAACYDCLMSYYNQREHALLDRQLVRELLLHLVRARTVSSPTPAPRATHLEHLLHQAGSELERRWLHWLDTSGYRLPDRAQVFVEACQTRPDFFFEDYQAAIYIDGPPYNYADRQARDLQQTEAMEDYGYTVIRFSHTDDWGQVVARYPHIFGTAQPVHVTLPRAPVRAADAELEPDLFDAQWHALLRGLAQELGSSIIEPGGDVALGGRVVGRYLAQVTLRRDTLWLIDAAEPDLERIKEAVTGDGHVPVVVSHEQWPEAVQGIVQMSREQ